MRYSLRPFSCFSRPIVDIIEVIFKQTHLRYSLWTSSSLLYWHQDQRSVGASTHTHMVRVRTDALWTSTKARSGERRSRFFVSQTFSCSLLPPVKPSKTAGRSEENSDSRREAAPRVVFFGQQNSLPLSFSLFLSFWTKHIPFAVFFPLVPFYIFSLLLTHIQSILLFTGSRSSSQTHPLLLLLVFVFLPAKREEGNLFAAPFHFAYVPVCCIPNFFSCS